MYERLFTKPNVNLVGFGYRYEKGERVGEGVVVGVRKKVPVAALSTHEVIPREFANFKTDVIEVGEIVPFNNRTNKHRPAPGGVSIGHYKISAGTLGCAVKDQVTKQPLILSNNHVLANSNDATILDAILQPGPADGGTIKDDHIAALFRFVPIKFLTNEATCPLSQTYTAIGNLISSLTKSSHKFQTIRVDEEAENRVDAAVAKPFFSDDLSWKIIDIGSPYGTKEVTLGDKITKSGRTTETTEGQIIIVDATVNVNYGSGKYAKFVDQLIAGPMSAGGDSGSLGVTVDGKFAFGLLFAGSNEVTIYNPIKSVLDELGIEL